MAEEQKQDNEAGRIKQLLRSLLEAIGWRSNESSYEDIRHKLQRAVDGMDAPGWMHFVQDVYDDNFIYQARLSDPTQIEIGGGIAEKYYRRGWSMDAEENIALGADAVEVREERSWMPVHEAVQNSTPTGQQGEKETMKTDDKRSTTCLVANECAHKDCSCEGAKAEQATPPGPATEQPIPAAAAQLETAEQYIASAPEHLRLGLQNALEHQTDARKKMLAALQANARNKFTAEQLEAKSIGELEALVELARVDVDYSGAAGGKANGNGAHQPRVLTFESAFAKK